MAQQRKDRIHARDLGIDLDGNADDQLFRWLVACLLFGARISQEIAADAFRVLDRQQLVTPDRLAAADRQHLVDLLGEARYRRYDESKARDLIRLGTDVADRYPNGLSAIADHCASRGAAAGRLQEFTGIGPTAADIFLRDVNADWPG